MKRGKEFSLLTPSTFVPGLYDGPMYAKSVEISISKSGHIRWVEQFKNCRSIDDVPKEKK